MMIATCSGSGFNEASSSLHKTPPFSRTAAIRLNGRGSTLSRRARA
jgi:hypothetical protein